MLIFLSRSKLTKAEFIEWQPALNLPVPPSIKARTSATRPDSMMRATSGLAVRHSVAR